LNIHHLELFYYVARYGGISAAVRNIPYGIQQPAVSGQILQLEEDLGLTLFQRRPFALTPAGEELYGFVRPFFEGLEPVAERLRGGGSQMLRLGASGIVLRDHLPAVVERLRPRYPRLKLMLFEAVQPQIEERLMRNELDLAVTILDGNPPPGTHAEKLLELPLALLLPKRHAIKDAGTLWKQDRIGDALISLPQSESVAKRFQQELTRRGVMWPVSIEVNSLELISTYVARGFGVGLTVYLPDVAETRGFRLLPLRDFPPVVIGVVWIGKPNPVVEAFIQELHERARAVSATVKA
jgi:DNA-binding transcriptional LysR family regulator